jgi:hypothetical protein
MLGGGNSLFSQPPPFVPPFSPPQYVSPFSNGPAQVPNNSSQAAQSPSSGANGWGRDTLALSKIEIPKFSGERLAEWAPFWDMFQIAVHLKPFPLPEKMAHLKSNLSGEALQIIQCLPCVGNNYYKALELLFKEYGNKEAASDDLHTELQKLSLLDTSTDSLKKFIHEVDTIYNQLEQVGEKVSDSKDFRATIEKRLPPSIGRRVFEQRENVLAPGGT